MFGDSIKNSGKVVITFGSNDIYDKSRSQPIRECWAIEDIQGKGREAKIEVSFA
jgi:hypothetical protein